MSAKCNSEIAVIGIDVGKLVSHRESGSAWRDRAAPEVVPRPSRTTARQPATVSDRHRGLLSINLKTAKALGLAPILARPRRRGDRIARFFAAFGTKRTFHD